MKYDIVTIGAATRDVFLASRDFKIIESKKFKTGFGECFAFGSKIEIKDIFLDTGGGATNAAVTFANLGLKTACVAKLGGDTDAAVIEDDLRARGVVTDMLVRAAKEKTGHSVILVTPSGHRTVLVFRGASAAFDARDLPWKRMRATWFYVTSLAGNIALYKKILDHAARIGAHVAWNPGGAELAKGWHQLAPLISRTSVFNINSEEAARLCGHAMTHTAKTLKKLEQLGSNIIVITDGSKGAYLCDDHGCWFAKTTGVVPVNTTGAGDAFGSGLVAGLALGHDILTSLRIATCNSEGVITKVGAKNGLLKRMPGKKTLEKVRVTKMTW